jgi:hypothetical protein
MAFLFPAGVRNFSFVRNMAHNTGQNLNTGISVFLICETGIPVFQEQIFFSINFDDRCNDVRKNK